VTEDAAGFPRRVAPNRSVTVSDVARRAGVSRASVSYALTQPDRASASMLERVNRAAAELGYVGNDAARQLRVGRSRAIGMIVLDAVNPVFSDVASGAETAARERGRFLFVANSDQDPDRELEYIDFFESQRVSGIIISPVGRIPDELLEIEKRGTPIVVVGETMGDKGVNFVTGDDEKGGYLAVQHLISEGRRRLMMVTGPPEPIRRRIAGARRAAAEAGLPFDTIEVDKQSIESGETAAAHLLEAGGVEGLPDGVFCGNDLLALGFLQQLIKSNVRVPERVSLVGYDDLAVARTAIVPLTSVRQPVKRMGSQAVEILVEHQAPSPPGKRAHIRFKPELVVRRSSTRDS
jgi:LacI family transcriptional regulator